MAVISFFSMAKTVLNSCRPSAGLLLKLSCLHLIGQTHPVGGCLLLDFKPAACLQTFSFNKRNKLCSCWICPHFSLTRASLEVLQKLHEASDLLSTNTSFASSWQHNTFASRDWGVRLYLRYYNCPSVINQGNLWGVVDHCNVFLKIIIFCHGKSETQTQTEKT